ncbi:MAG: homoserine dehydrogenase [Verrucomicrobiae bacterium]|nr:homoserine dehydrogenase [Verrucomicrobiae bacterium]
MQQVNFGMIGGGTVGSGVYHALQLNQALMESRLDIKINLHKIAVKAFDEPRPYPIPREIMTTNWREVVEAPQVQVVIELAGGITVARDMVLSALKLGKPVITANKALLSAYGEELFSTAAKHNTTIYYEASVAGGIPIIKAVREAFIGNKITHIYGIVNGTCNYILTKMKQEGADFAEVLSQAQKHGYAEAEPSLDVDGWDSMHKIGILASLAHGFWVLPSKIYVEGIRNISKLDIKFASQLGYTIKLLGIVKRFESDKKNPGGKLNGSRVQVSVYPALVPDSHVLANVNDVFNAVFVRGDIVGDTLFYGRGAGKDATASAVLSDIADAALDIKNGRGRLRPFVPHEKNGKILPIGEIESQYYIRLSVIDKPGVLAKISAIFGNSNISIASVIQPEARDGESVPLIMMIHKAPNAAMTKALQKIEKLPVVKSKPVMIRVETFE